MKNITSKIILLLIFFIITNLIIQIINIDVEIIDDQVLPVHQIAKENLFHELKREENSSWLNVSVETNSIGLRDKEYSENKNNSTRIIIIGDSVTFGIGVNNEDTYPNILEEMLNSNLNKTFEVWNAGVSCYTPVEYLAELNRLSKYEPDMIIIGFFYHEFQDKICFVFDEKSFIKNSKILSFFEKSFIKKISLYKLIKKNIYNKQKKKAILEYNKKIESIDQINAFLEIISVVKESNLDLLILNIPKLEEPYYLRLEQSIINSIRTNNTVIDILKEYQKAGSNWENDLRFDQGDQYHVNRKGHELIANIIYEYLIELT